MNLEQLIAADLVRYFPASLIPADADVRATREKYGFVQYPAKAYNFDVINGTIYYAKQDVIDKGLTPAPNGEIIPDVVWETKAPEPVIPTSSIIAVRDATDQQIEANFPAALRPVGYFCRYLAQRDFPDLET